ncbi:MAG: carboxypeptidase-like regulatory domain-containing protein [Pseudomonadota bacterium]
MKNFNKIFIFCLIALMTLGLGQAAFAAKTLSLSKTVSVNNTGNDAARTATLDLALEGGANDVNGLVFTLKYNPAVFTFEGLVKGDMEIDDGSTYNPDSPPSAATIASTLYYQANNKPAEGIVMIAAAAANFFTTNSSATFTAFKAKFKVKLGVGNGKYPIDIQKTIIGPDTAANAGYTVPTLLAVAAGLAPDADPTTAQTYAVLFSPGLITVTGGYTVSGTAVYGGTPEVNADGAVANLIQVLASGNYKVDTQAVNSGAYSFTKVPSGTYQVEILSTKPGFQKRAVTASFPVAGADVTVPKITLAEYQAQSGKVSINGSAANLSGLRVVIKSDGQVIGTAAVDANGNYVTPPLPTPLPGTITLWAVYGTQQIQIDNAVFDWTLSLGTVSGTITGLCDDQMVEVFIRSETVGIQKAVMVTGAGGSNDYTLYNLLPGTDYVLSVVGEGVAVFYDGTEDFSSATAVSVVANTDTADRDFALTCGDLMTISGTVTVDGTAVSGAIVKANNFNFDAWKFGSDETDSNGDFEIKVAKSADYYVYFELDGIKYYHKTGSNAVTVRSDATKVDVTTANATGKNIPVVIGVPDTAILEGYVTLNRSKDNNGIPLENYLVFLSTTSNVPLPYVTRTNKDGYYTFTQMAPATYNVNLRPLPPYADQMNQGVVLTNATTVRSDFIVDQNFRISGSVLDNADGTTAVVNARVDILKSNGSKQRSPAFTDGSGDYTLVDIPSGVYTLVASHSEYYPASLEKQVISDLSDVDILMTKGAIITGIVSDASGVVKDAVVTLIALNSNYAKSTKTNASGVYTFNGLKANTPHLIRAGKGNDYQVYVDDVTTGNLGSTTTKNITLIIPPTTWTFGGTITDDSGPVAKAYVLIFSPTTEYRRVTQTNTSGVFTFSKVIDGTDYSLLVLPGNGKPELTEDNIAIQANIANHNIVLPTSATISGTVTLSEADADAIVTVGAYDPATGDLHEAKTQTVDNISFTYAIEVKAGVAYKVLAQDLTGTFALKYYASDQANTTGTYAQATNVTNDTTGVNITLTK